MSPTSPRLEEPTDAIVRIASTAIERAPWAYEAFQKKLDGAIKIVLHP